MADGSTSSRPAGAPQGTASFHGIAEERDHRPISETPHERFPPRLSSWGRPTYLLLVAVASAWLLVKAVPAILAATADSQPYDLISDYQPARAIWEGYDPYTPEGLRRSGADKLGASAFGLPPSSVFWILPLAGMDLKQANRTWCWLTVLTLLFELALVMNALRCPAPNATAWLVFSYVLWSPVTLYHLGVGQFSQAIGFLFVLTWLELRQGRQVTAGLALGAACSMKAFPFTMLLHALLTRRYRTFVTAIVTDLGISATMTALLGLRSWPEFLRRQPIMASHWMNSTQNISLHGIVSRWFFPACGGQGHTLIVATAIYVVLALSILGVFGWWTRDLSRSASAFDLTFAAFVTLSVFTSQWAWEHYKLIYILPLAVLAAELVGIVRRRRARWLAVLTATAIAFAGIELQESPWTKTSLDVRTAHLRLHVLEVLNWAPTAVMLIAFGCLLFDRVREWSSSSARTHVR